MAAGAAGEAPAMEALERLARAYWQPLFIFVRQRGMSHDDAADAVQGFFAHMLGRDPLRGVERRETRFRTFLLRCFSNWLTSEHRKDAALKRGGAVFIVPWSEFDSDEARMEPDSVDSPELAFDRRWARTVFELAQSRLAEDIATRGRPDFLQEISRRVFHPGAEGPNWAEVAQAFSTNEGAVRKAAADLRGRFAALLRQEVSAAVSEDAEVDDELRYLFRLLSSPKNSA